MEVEHGFRTPLEYDAIKQSHSGRLRAIFFFEAVLSPFLLPKYVQALSVEAIGCIRFGERPSKVLSAAQFLAEARHKKEMELKAYKSKLEERNGKRVKGKENLKWVWTCR
ncbi:MAG: hypothetical protein ABEH43_10090, partial [Flavobacteriales bacterium]